LATTCALDIYGAAIALDARNEVYLSNRAAALIHLKRYIEAIDDCKRAVALDPGFSRAHERLMSAYRHLEMHDLEAEALGEVVKLNPTGRIANDLRSAQKRVGGVATQSAPDVCGDTGASGIPDLDALMGAMSGAGVAGAGGVPDLGSLTGMMGAGEDTWVEFEESRGKGVDKDGTGSRGSGYGREKQSDKYGREASRDD
jgi:small glutamine-rich tetratricopeptide repeat-containing protein alpha